MSKSFDYYLNRLTYGVLGLTSISIFFIFKSNGWDNDMIVIIGLMVAAFIMNYIWYEMVGEKELNDKEIGKIR